MWTSFDDAVDPQAVLTKTSFSQDIYIYALPRYRGMISRCTKCLAHFDRRGSFWKWYGGYGGFSLVVRELLVRRFLHPHSILFLTLLLACVVPVKSHVQAASCQCNGAQNSLREAALPPITWLEH